jgi:hypothetical protein
MEMAAAFFKIAPSSGYEKFVGQSTYNTKVSVPFVLMKRAGLPFQPTRSIRDSVKNKYMFEMYV